MTAFYVEVCNDYERLRKAVASLRSHYDSELIIVSDGSQFEAEIEEISTAVNGTFVRSSRLFLPESGYSLWERRIQLWNKLVQANATHVICFDTDAIYHRRFSGFPNANLPYVFGRTWTDNLGRLGIKGGCYGITAEAVRALVTHFNPEHLPPVKLYDRPGYDEPTIWVDESGIHVWRQAGIKKRVHCDFGVDVKKPMIGNFAVTHPHK